MTETPFDYRLFSSLAPLVIVLEVVVLYRLQRLWKFYHARLLWVVIGLSFMWLSLDFFRVVAADSSSIYVLQILSNLFLFFIPPSWFLLAYSYFLGQSRIPKWIIYTVYIIPAILSAILLTNHIHHLYWIETEIVRLGVFIRLNVEEGPAYWLNIVQGFSFIGASLVLYAQRLNSVSGLPKNNIKLLLVALALPTVFELIYLSGIISGWQKDMVPIIFGISTMLLHEAFLPGYRSFLVKSELHLSGELSQTT